MSAEIDAFIARHGITRCPTRYAVASPQGALDNPRIVPIVPDRRRQQGGWHWRARRHRDLFKNAVDKQKNDLVPLNKERGARALQRLE